MKEYEKIYNYLKYIYIIATGVLTVSLLIAIDLFLFMAEYNNTSIQNNNVSIEYPYVHTSMLGIAVILLIGFSVSLYLFAMKIKFQIKICLRLDIQLDHIPSSTRHKPVVEDYEAPRTNFYSIQNKSHMYQSDNSLHVYEDVDDTKYKTNKDEGYIKLKENKNKTKFFPYSRNTVPVPQYDEACDDYDEVKIFSPSLPTRTGYKQLKQDEIEEEMPVYDDVQVFNPSTNIKQTNSTETSINSAQSKSNIPPLKVSDFEKLKENTDEEEMPEYDDVQIFNTSTNIKQINSNETSINFAQNKSPIPPSNVLGFEKLKQNTDEEEMPEYDNVQILDLAENIKPTFKTENNSFTTLENVLDYGKLKQNTDEQEMPEYNNVQILDLAENMKPTFKTENSSSSTLQNVSDYGKLKQNTDEEEMPEYDKVEVFDISTKSTINTKVSSFEQLKQN